MRKVSFICGIAVLTLALVLFLASCSTAANPAGSALQASPSPTVVSTHAPQPSPTETAPLQRPLPTATPAPTAKPSDAPLDAGDYYVVPQNGRDGVVDRNGKVVLEPDFVRVNVVSAYSYGYESFIGKALFFAVPAQTGPAKAKRRSSGFLYGSNGTMVTPERLSFAQAVSQDLIAIVKAPPGDYVDNNIDEENAYTPANTTGAMLYTGSLVIPYQYEEIYQFGKTAAALKAGAANTASVDFYDLNGKLLGSKPAYFDSENSIGGVEPCGDLLIMENPDGKYGILDEELQWVSPPEWQQIQYDEVTGQFIVMKDNRIGVIDGKGHDVIPQAYLSQVDLFGNSRELQEYALDKSYVFYNADGVYLYDKNGAQILHSSSYNNIEYSNGVIIAQHAVVSEYDLSASRSDMYDASGNLLISIADDIDTYYPEEGYFASGTKVYDSKGNALPLPKNDGVVCLTADRFAVSISPQSDNGYGDICGLCDAQGRWIMKPDSFVSLKPIGGNALIYTVPNDESESGVMYGLADLDGHILTGPVFFEFFTYPGDLIYASTATMSGLMDRSFSWVWKTTIYDDLTD